MHWPTGIFIGLLTAITAAAGTFTESFDSDPAGRGWRTFGDTSLFGWNPTAQNLQVTWNSSRPNSYFYRPLGVTVTRTNDFSFTFDLRLNDLALGVTPGKTETFQIAAGFLNFAAATNVNFIRGTGTDSPHIVEWDYFPDSGFGATISPSVVSSNGNFYTSFSFPLELTPGDLFRVTLAYSAATQTLRTTMTQNGQPFGPINDVVLDGNFSDFRADTVAITSYSDAGQPAQFAGSVLAHATVDNLVVVVPDPLGVPPTILSQPVSQTVTAGGSVTFSVGAAGTAPLTYQWRRENVDLFGATAATLTLTNVQPIQAGSYTVVISNVAGFTNSAAALLVVDTVPLPPTVTGRFVGGTWRVQFTAEARVVYRLQRSVSFPIWADVSSVTTTGAGSQELADLNPPADRAFYRVEAQRP